MSFFGRGPVSVLGPGRASHLPPFRNFRNEEGELSHKTSVIVSDVLSYNTSTVFAFLRINIIDHECFTA